MKIYSYSFQKVQQPEKIIPRKLPKVRSTKFLMSMLVVFLARIDPASRNPNPACMKMMIEPMITKYIALIFDFKMSKASPCISTFDKRRGMIKEKLFETSAIL